MPMWGYYAGGGMGWWLILTSIFWLVLAGIAVWAVVSWLSRASRGTTPPQMPPQQSALGILNARYARGEIDTATYQAMREQLEAPTSLSAPKAIPGGR
jgi:putative membrane protein